MVDAGTAIEALQAMVDAGVDAEKAVDLGNELLNSTSDAGIAIEITQAMLDAGASPEDALQVGSDLLEPGPSAPSGHLAGPVPDSAWSDSQQFDAEIHVAPGNARATIEVMQGLLSRGERAEAVVVLGNALLAARSDGPGAPPLQAPMAAVREFVDSGGHPGVALLLGVVLFTEERRREERSRIQDASGFEVSAIEVERLHISVRLLEPLPVLSVLAATTTRDLSQLFADIRVAPAPLVAFLAPEARVVLSDGKEVPAWLGNILISMSQQSRERAPLIEPGYRTNADNPMTRAAQVSGGQYLGLPVSGPITSPFGKAHPTGLDIGAQKGTPIYAPAPGTVLRVIPSIESGGTRDPGSRSGAAVVILEHEGGWMSAYRHMDDVELPLSLREGAPISRGDFIGLVGETGSPGQPHLHFEVGFGLQPGGSNAYDDPARLVS